MPRPKLPDERRRGYRLQIRLTDVEHRALELAAKYDGRSVSKWSRDILMAVIQKHLPMCLDEANKCLMCNR